MDDFSAEIVDSRDDGGKGLFVVVVACAHEDKAALKCLGRAISVDGKRPGLLVRGPIGRVDLVPELDFLVDAIHGSRLADVLHDQRALSDGFLLRPWPPWEAEGIEVRVRANTGIIEQVPGATNCVPSLQDGEVEFRILRLKAVGEIDTGDASSNDDDIVIVFSVVCNHLARLREVRWREKGNQGAKSWRYEANKAPSNC